METIQSSVLWWLTFVMAIVPYTPLIVGLIKDPTDKSHTFLAWFLYLSLDSVTFFSGEKIRINMDPMAFGFAIGSLIMASTLFYQKRFINLGVVEIVTIILLFICFIVWAKFGSYYAFVISIVSEIIVGIYLIIQTFNFPKVKYNLTGYVGFLIVSVFSMIFTKTWSVSEVGFATSETILNIIILIPLFKKRWDEKQLKKQA